MASFLLFPSLILTTSPLVVLVEMEGMIDVDFVEQVAGIGVDVVVVEVEAVGVGVVVEL